MMRWLLAVLAGAALLAASGPNPAKAATLGNVYASEANRARADVVPVRRLKKKHYRRRHHRGLRFYYGPRYYYPYYGPYYGRRYYRRHHRRHYYRYRPGFSLYFRF